nr:Hydroxy-delta-5-steroid dehydrogenase, 3 beta- and steroid delta-isomerase 1 [Danio rerio]AAI64774.1 Hsd3b1 protein [Danio rerio]
MALSGEVCVVTGACGFLGEKLVRLLLEEENLSEIRLLDRNIRSELIQTLEDGRGETKVSVIEGDIRDRELLRRACKGATLVFHTASLIDYNGAVEYSELHAVNVKATRLLLETCIQQSVSSFIYTSSIEVAGPNHSGDPIINGHEDTPYSSYPISNYSKTKLEAEQICLQANGELLRDGGHLATCALRPMFIYGPGCRFTLIKLRDAIRSGNVQHRLSQQSAKVNPVYVGNAALAHLQAGRALRDPEKRAVVGGNFYYVSDDTPHISYCDLTHALMSPLGFSIQNKPILPIFLLYLLAFFMEILQAVLRPVLRFTPPLNRQLVTMVNTPFSFSYQKACREFGYSPRYDWEEARRSTTDWLASVLPAERRLANKT